MNKACVKCGKIMLVPDIPLPRNYKQKCTSCDHMNPVGEDLYYEENPDERPEDSIDLVDFDDRYVDPLDLSRGGMAHDSADEWMEKIKSHPLPVDDTANTPATLEDPFVPPAPESDDGFSTDLRDPVGPDPSSLEVVEQVRKEFSDVLESLKEERAKFQKNVNEKLNEMAREIEQLHRQTNEFQSNRTDTIPQKRDFSPPIVAHGEVLLCSQNSSLIATCEESLAKVGLQVNTATSHDLALQRIQEYAYQTLVLDQQFVSGSKTGQAVLNGVRKITLNVRRHQSVVMLTPGVPSGESQVFYQWGIDLNVHTDDLADLGGYVKELLQTKTELLSPYLNSDMDVDRLIT